jgi:hypothetical protein
MIRRQKNEDSSAKGNASALRRMQYFFRQDGNKKGYPSPDYKSEKLLQLKLIKPS